MKIVDKDLIKKLKKINRYILLDMFLHKDEYYFNNGQTKEIKDIFKENINYHIVKCNTDIRTKNYIVFLIISTDNKNITHQLLKEFNNVTSANKYFKDLHSFVLENSNTDIINTCYKELAKFPRKNIFNKYIVQ